MWVSQIFRVVDWEVNFNDMDISFDDDPFEPSSSSSSCTTNQNVEEAEAVHELLEEGWFFGKLLVNSKTRLMLRCYSDPSPNFDQQILAKTTSSPGVKSSSTSKLITSGNLIRAPSLPPNIGRQEKMQETGISKRKLSRQLSDRNLVHQKLTTRPSCVQTKEGNVEEEVISRATTSTRRSKTMDARESSKNTSLLRATSLPPKIGRINEEMIQENASDEISMSKLIREAMPLSSKILPRQCNSKMMPKYRPPRISEVESIDAFPVNCKETRNRYPPNNQRKLKKSLSNLEFHEVQGFKDLGFTFDKRDLDPKVVGMLADLKGKKNDNKQNQQDKVMGVTDPSSKAWQVKSCARTAPPSPIPVCAAKNSAQDMKAQLKFWARAVASNVR